jgi:hypothetical protein
MSKLPIAVISSVGAALLLAFLSPVALAGPPFVTDDPEPVEYQHWEVYIAPIYSHGKDGIS